MSRIYTTVQGDMWDMIAYKEMGSVDYTDDLMNANSSLLSRVDSAHLYAPRCALILSSRITARTCAANSSP